VFTPEPRWLAQGRVLGQDVRMTSRRGNTVFGGGLLVVADGQPSRPRVRPHAGLRSLAAVLAVALCSAALALPFGDASGGWNFAAGPLLAGVVSGAFLRSRSNWFAVLAVASVVVTLLLMIITVLVVIAVWGL
jgi:hypothetical protein